MTEQELNLQIKILWGIADQLREAMNADAVINKAIANCDALCHKLSLNSDLNFQKV